MLHTLTPSIMRLSSTALLCGFVCLLPVSAGTYAATSAGSGSPTSGPDPMKALIWDVDLSLGVRLPAEVLNRRGVGGTGNGGPGTGHGLAANLYGNVGAFPPTNGGIPQLANLSLHVAALKRGVPALIPDQGFHGVCLIDLESMRADWNSTTPAMREQSVAFAMNDTALAKQQYESSARVFFETTISVIRQLRPGCRLGWYGYPRSALPHVATPQWLAYCRAHPGTCSFDTGGVGNATGYGGPGGAAQRAINDGLGWLFASLDIITPACYLGEQPAQTTDADTADYVSSTVREAKRLAVATGERTPVVAVTWLNYDDFWDPAINRTAPRPLLSHAHAAIELGVPMDSGADGVLIWGHLDAADSAASSNSVTSYNRYSSTVLTSVVAKICSTHTCCSNASQCPALV